MNARQSPAEDGHPRGEDVIFNVPNLISMARMALSLLVFVLMVFKFFWAALVLFIIAASTDWMDGWWARKYDQVTKLGRVLDPICDKVLICGIFILLAEAMADFPWFAKISGWMAVVVVGRELIVTVLRGLIESGGGDFSAKMHGKIKMWFQCFAAGAGLAALAFNGSLPGNEGVPGWLHILLILFAWSAVASTLYSGWLYVQAAAAVILRPAPPANGA